MRPAKVRGKLLALARRKPRDWRAKKLAVTTKNRSGRYCEIERREAIARERADQQVVCSPGANASASVARGISCLGRDQCSLVATNGARPMWPAVNLTEVLSAPWPCTRARPWLLYACRPSVSRERIRLRLEALHPR
jgi:hypothetical protein